MLKNFGVLKTPEARVALISLAHGINDMYAAFLSTFLPFIKENLGLSYSLAGSFNVIVGFFHIIGQPVIGYLSDRMRRPILMMLGPIFCGVGAIMLPNTRSYWPTIFFAGMWGLGSALYHPQGNGGIGYVARPEKLTGALTWFNIGGMLGGMLSPLVAVGVVHFWGYKGLFVTLIPAVMLSALIFFSMPLLRQDVGTHRAGLVRTLGSLFKSLYPLWVVAATRDLLFQCVRFFLPMKIVAEGGDLAAVGLVVFLTTFGGTVSMPFAVAAARRIGDSRTIFRSLLLGFMVMTAGGFVSGWWVVLFYITGLSCVYSTLSITSAMAQRLMPDERSAGSSIVTGLAWGVSNILILPFGGLADLVGIDMSLVITSMLPLIPLPFFFMKMRALQDTRRP
ncbi:MAG: MFS transporter [Synergistaceae bacterium]|jgi:FSR family fosmidomycin resistance protein-like MFS transporter|nr:MFS transporter [Synergistaceae bacterium]